MDKVTLTQEKETLLIPLYGKAMDASNQPSILSDEKAQEIVAEINYDFSELNIQRKTNLMMCMRAALLDNLVAEKLKDSKKTLVLHLGCGLDSRCLRVGESATEWWDVDFPEVIDLRRTFYKETATYHMIGSSVTEAAWIERIPTGFEKVLVVAEGLVMYLNDESIKTLLSRLKARLKSFDLIMDVYSSLTAKSAKNHPSIKKTGVTTFWGLNDPKTLENWGLGITHQKTDYFTQFKLENLKPAEAVMFSLANRIKVAKNAHRIEIYHIKPT